METEKREINASVAIQVLPNVVGNEEVVRVVDEVIEFIEEPSLDELSDISYSINRIAGTFIGKARVIRVFSEAERLQPGEILVTINTDPSWTPLFSIAGAIVVEVGSMLSHGAVVAREAGIPAVLGIPGIVSFIKDGYTLIVDGTEGKVIISENL